MLRICSRLPAQQRQLQHWQSSDELPLARHAQFVLWSARGGPSLRSPTPWAAAAGPCADGCMPS